jgi:NADH-quinone oxidoreductase subunit H
MIWFRGTFPRFRYDQLMNIGWKYMIPIGMGAILRSVQTAQTAHQE